MYRNAELALHRRYRGQPARTRPPPEKNTRLRPKRVITVSVGDE
jgi:hypothetical protein